MYGLAWVVAACAMWCVLLLRVSQWLRCLPAVLAAWAGRQGICYLPVLGARLACLVLVVASLWWCTAGALAAAMLGSAAVQLMPGCNG
jgi:hypothetical protein